MLIITAYYIGALVTPITRAYFFVILNGCIFLTVGEIVTDRYFNF